MRRRLLVFGGLAVLLLAVAGGLLVGGKGELEGSALSRGPGGYLVARRYLEARGCRVDLLDGSFEERTTEGAVLMAFPWQVADSEETLRIGLERHLMRRGTIVLAISRDFRAAGQLATLSALDLGWDTLRPDPPLVPWRWWTYESERWEVAGAEAVGEIGAPRWFPRMPVGGQALWSRGKTPFVFTFTRRGGRVAVLPAEMLNNAGIQQAENLRLLEQLWTGFGTRWMFDEYHHALFAPTLPRARTSVAALDVFLVHLCLLYGMVVWAVGRRLGVPWTEPQLLSGSTATFLVALGALHHRLGHHAAAARLLLERAREFDRRVVLPRGDGGVTDGPGLQRLGDLVARAQARRGRI